MNEMSTKADDPLDFPRAASRFGVFKICLTFDVSICRRRTNMSRDMSTSFSGHFRDISMTFPTTCVLRIFHDMLLLPDVKTLKCQTYVVIYTMTGKYLYYIELSVVCLRKFVHKELPVEEPI